MATRSVVQLVPAVVVEHPPSVADGSLTLEEEAAQRAYGCGWIQQVCILLRLPAVTMASAQSIFHRFYYRRSMAVFDLKVVAAASVYLSGKLCETPRRVKDVVNVYVFMDWLEMKEQKVKELQAQGVLKHTPAAIPADNDDDTLPSNAAAENQLTHHHLQEPSASSKERQQSASKETQQSASKETVDQIFHLVQSLEAKLQFPSPNSKEFRRLKTYVHRSERHILRETGFLVSQALVHPHRFILQYIHSLLGTSVVSEESKKVICQRAWGYLNDSYVQTRRLTSKLAARRPGTSLDVRTLDVQARRSTSKRAARRSGAFLGLLPNCFSVLPELCLFRMRTPLCCSVQPAALTAAAIRMACRDLGLVLPRRLPWPLCFDVTWDEMDAVEASLDRLYSASAVHYRKLAEPPVPPAAVVEEDGMMVAC